MTKSASETLARASDATRSAYNAAAVDAKNNTITLYAATHQVSGGRYYLDRLINRLGKLGDRVDASIEVEQVRWGLFNKTMEIHIHGSAKTVMALSLFVDHAHGIKQLSSSARSLDMTV